MVRKKKRRKDETEQNKLGEFLFRHEIAIVLATATVLVLLLDAFIYFIVLSFFQDFEISTTLNKINPRMRDTLHTMKTWIVLFANVALFAILCPLLSKALHKISGIYANEL